MGKQRSLHGRIMPASQGTKIHVSKQTLDTLEKFKPYYLTRTAYINEILHDAVVRLDRSAKEGADA